MKRVKEGMKILKDAFVNLRKEENWWWNKVKHAGKIMRNISENKELFKEGNAQWAQGKRKQILRKRRKRRIK